MTFVIYDIVFLVLFSIFVAWFLFKNKKSLEKEGILFLYRTKWGMKFIDKVGGKYKKTLDFLRYLIIPTSYLLMIGIFYLILKTVYEYISNALLIEAIGNSPPIALVIPYFPKIFGLSDFFPPFYFIYFLLAILIVAGVHEFAHGIFMRRYKIKIKSTGIAFLGPILGAFVEQDEKDMLKAKKLDQMTVLGAGVFANLVTTIIFFILITLFFSFAFTPAGVIFDGYQVTNISTASILSVNNVLVNNPTYEQINDLINEDGLTQIQTIDNSYLANKVIIGFSSNIELYNQQGQLIFYEDAPAIKNDLSGAINDINGVKITSLQKLQSELMKYSPGDEVKIITTEGEFYIVLDENPNEITKPRLGVGFRNQESNLPKSVFHFLSSTKPELLTKINNIYYTPNYNYSEFVYYLLWWIVILNFLVALFNMVPAGIFDGGRFFYLTVLGITGKESIAKKSSKFLGYLFLFMLFLIVFTWIYRLIF